METPPLRPVPRSKGCITCTSRKKRCDGRRPTCQACERRKQVCRGYRRGDFVFMSEGWVAPGVASPVPVPVAKSSDSKSQISKNTPTLPSISRPITSDPRSVYASFFLSQFDTRQQRSELSMVMVENYRRYFGVLLEQSPCGNGNGINPLPHAAEALVTNYFGKLNASPRLMHNSTVPYIKALKSMSARIAHIQRIGIASINEEEVMQLIFTCLYLAFWELAMDPQGTSWQKHARGLANIIQSRGPRGFRSPQSVQVVTLTRHFILLESVSSKRRTFLSNKEWHRFRNLDPGPITWLNTKDTSRQPDTLVGPKHCLDFIVDHLITISDLTAEFSENLTKPPSPSSLHRMEAESERVLCHLEPVLAQMVANIGGNAVKTAATAKTTPRGPLWGKPLEYKLASICRTAAVTLRLLMCDVLREQQRHVDTDGTLLIQDHINSRDDNSRLSEHRAALMAHVEAIVNMIPYSSQVNIFGVAPLCFVPAFRIAKVVLARECDALRAEGGKDAEVDKCVAADAVIQQHLDFVASRKISIKVDV
ncbi:hypothetical protein B0T16DRAFT_73566 [Cercophora newfieldiana]|uniref:Zn(2)-C6 fungal-type domain-containing protein n=1 Tax=Cercophora newfieldiana TaxID=92897 RepID=A0AA40CVX7_9PEZI|nr:hypothetical protein B0T16DRAFT_73566 [Cercophora newfieldiana]